MSRAADGLRLSGLAGLGLAVIYGNYQEALLSPATLGGASAPPGWMTATHVHLMGLSIIILLFSFFIDDLFVGYRELTAAVAILGQWLEPLAITFNVGFGVTAFGPIGQVMAAVNLVVFFAFLVNYLRRGWGTAGA